MNSKKMNSKKYLSAFSLIELIFVVLLIAIVVLIAIPTYKDYIIRSRISGIVDSMSSEKLKIQSNFLNNDFQFSSYNVQPNNKYIDTIDITNGRILVKGKSTELFGKQIELTFNPELENQANSFKWKCYTKPEFFQIVPNSCHNNISNLS